MIIYKNIHIERRNLNLKKIDLQKAMAMRNEGQTFQAIADEFGVSKQAVQQRLKRYEAKALRIKEELEEEKGE